MSPARLVLGIASLLVGVWFLSLVFLPEEPAPAPAMAFTTSEQCRDCHVVPPQCEHRTDLCLQAHR